MIDLNQLQIIGEAVITEGAILRTRVGGFSMYPYVQQNDIACIEKIDAPLLIGDIIVFKTGNKIVAHRLLRFATVGTDTKLLCKGDSCWRMDAPVDRMNVVGRITQIERNRKKTDLTTLHQQKKARIIARLSFITPIPYLTVRIINKLSKTLFRKQIF